MVFNSFWNLVSDITVGLPSYLDRQLSIHIASCMCCLITSVPKCCSTHLGVTVLPNFFDQNSSGCSLHCLLLSPLPSSISRSQLNMALTASLRLLAKESLRNPCCCSNLFDTVSLPEPINPTTPISIGLLYYFFRRFSISLIASLTVFKMEILRPFLCCFKANMLMFSRSCTSVSSSSKVRSE